MKKIFLVLTVSAFSLAAYAGGPESSAKNKAACAEKAACADKAKVAAGATCQEAKTACCDSTLAGKNGAKKVKIVQSPRAAGVSDRAS